MTLFKKLAPGRLSRAILTLTGRSGNKRMQMAQASLSETPDRPLEGEAGRKPLCKRTTITLETERLLVVRSERRSSGSPLESQD